MHSVVSVKTCQHSSTTIRDRLCLNYLFLKQFQILHLDKHSVYTYLCYRSKICVRVLHTLTTKITANIATVSLQLRRVRSGKEENWKRGEIILSPQFNHRGSLSIHIFSFLMWQTVSIPAETAVTRSEWCCLDCTTLFSHNTHIHWYK